MYKAKQNAWIDPNYEKAEGHSEDESNTSFDDRLFNLFSTMLKRT